MANSKNARDRKKENFNAIGDIMADPIRIMIIIAIIILSGVAVFLYVKQTHQSGAGMMDLLSDTSPMAPLTVTPN